MLLDQASDAQIRGAQIIAGLTMAAFIGARVFGRGADRVRWFIAGLYLAAILVFVVYALL